MISKLLHRILKKRNKINHILYELDTGIVYCSLCNKVMRKMDKNSPKRSLCSEYIDFESMNIDGYYSSRFESSYKKCCKKITSNDSTFPIGVQLCINCYRYISNEDDVKSGWYDIKVLCNDFFSAQKCDGNFGSFCFLMCRNVWRWIRFLCRKWWYRLGIKVRLWRYSY